MKQSRKSIVQIGVFMLVICLWMHTNALAKTLLKMNHQFPADAAGSKIDQWFADEVEKATDGEVEIKIFWENKLGKPKENLLLLKRGVIDMAAMSAGYFPNELPLFSAPNSIPMGLDDVCQSSELMKSFMNNVPAFMEEAAQSNIRPLFFHLINPYLLVTKEPVTSFSDLKGKRIRIWGKDMPLLVNAAGGKPVPLFLPDIYDALKKGIIDGCPFSVDFVITYKIYELAKHITEVVMWEGPGWGLWISEKAWQKLSPQHQQSLFEIAEQARQRELEATAASEKASREFLQTQGVEFHPFPPAELTKWQEANPDFLADWIKKMEALGQGDAAKQTVDLWNNIRQTIACPE